MKKKISKLTNLRDLYGKWTFTMGRCTRELKADPPLIHKALQEGVKRRTVRVKSVLP